MTTEQQLRQQVVDQITAWKGAVKGDVRHHYIIDTYNSIQPLPLRNGKPYRLSYNEEWCAATVSADFQAVGLIDLIPPECSCGEMMRRAMSMGIWVERDDHTPQPGDIMLYDWQDDGKGDNTGAPDHVGIVTAINGKSITVTEGNRTVNGKSMVADRPMTVNGRYIRGYICPDYAAKARELNTKEQEDNDVSREEIKAMIDEAVQTVRDELEGKIYTSREEAPRWAQPAIQWAQEQKILNGDEHGKLHLTLDNLINLQMLYQLQVVSRMDTGKEGE